jgi:hypothetical protein
MKIPNFLNINCQEATMLGSKQVETKLTLMENIKLKFHYAICKPCEYFALQVKLINSSLKKMSSDSTISFSDQKKNEIQNQINKNM